MGASTTRTPSGRLTDSMSSGSGLPGEGSAKGGRVEALSVLLLDFDPVAAALLQQREAVALAVLRQIALVEQESGRPLEAEHVAEAVVREADPDRVGDREDDEGDGREDAGQHEAPDPGLRQAEDDRAGGQTDQSQHGDQDLTRGVDALAQIERERGGEASGEPAEQILELDPGQRK